MTGAEDVGRSRRLTNVEGWIQFAPASSFAGWARSPGADCPKSSSTGFGTFAPSGSASVFTPRSCGVCSARASVSAGLGSLLGGGAAGAGSGSSVTLNTVSVVAMISPAALTSWISSLVSPLAVSGNRRCRSPISSGLQIPSRRAVGPATRQRGANRQSIYGDDAAKGHSISTIECNWKDYVFGICFEDGRHGQDWGKLCRLS